MSLFKSCLNIVVISFKLLIFCVPVSLFSIAISANGYAESSDVITAEVDGVEFSWEFDESVEYGYFVDGMPWIVVPETGVFLIHAFPSRENNVDAWDFANSAENPADINITVINPPVGFYIDDPDHPSGPRFKSIAAFGWDSRGAVREGGWGTDYDSNLGWDGVTSVRVKPGDVITTPKSFVSMVREEPDIWNLSNTNIARPETVLEAVAVLTVLEAKPPENSFRPGVLRSDDRRSTPEFITTNDILNLEDYLIDFPDFDLHGNSINTDLYDSEDPDKIPMLFRSERLTQLFPGPMIMNTNLSVSRSYHGYRNNSGPEFSSYSGAYSADLGMAMGDLAIGSIANWLDTEDRLECQIRFLQRAIDIYEAVEAGLSLTYDGGQQAAHGLILALAGRMLNHQGMKSMNESVHGLDPLYYFSDYAQVLYYGDPANPGPDAPDISSRRFIDKNSHSFDLDGFTICGSEIFSRGIDHAGRGAWVRFNDDFEWVLNNGDRIYRAARQIPNTKFKITSGAGASDQVYVVTDLVDHINGDNFGGTHRGNQRVYGGKVYVKPHWVNGWPDSSSVLEFSVLSECESNRWIFDGSGTTRNNGHLALDPTSGTVSPFADYSAINARAYMTLSIANYALQNQENYDGGYEKYYAQAGSIPGYGEALFAQDANARLIYRPQNINWHLVDGEVLPKYDGTPAFIGALWKKYVLDVLGYDYVQEGDPYGALELMTDFLPTVEDYCVMPDPVPNPPVNDFAGMESGALNIDHNWKTVYFMSSFAEAPIVVTSPPSPQEDDPILVEIRQVTQESFQVRATKWNYQIQDENVEIDDRTFVYFLAVDPSLDSLGGLSIQSGRIGGKVWDRSGDNPWTTVNFPYGKFDRRPVVLVAYERMAAGQKPVSLRLDNVSRNSFEFMGQNEELVFWSEEVSAFPHIVIQYIAIEIGWSESLPFDLRSFRVNVNPDDSGKGGLNHEWRKIYYGEEMLQPNTFAHVQSMRGADPFGLRFTHGPNANYIRLRIEEEQSWDDETNHVREDVGVIVIGNGE